MKQFKNPKRAFGDVEASKASRLVSAATDLALVVETDGSIKDISFSNEDYEKFGVGNWVGKKLREVVTLECESKVAAMLQSTKHKATLKWYEVNHPIQGFADLPMRYRVLRLNTDGPFLALGRDLKFAATFQQQLVKAQVQVDRERERSAQAEIRYQVLFRFSSEAIVIISAATLRIVDANPAALTLLSSGSRPLEGYTLTELLDESSRDSLDSFITAAKSAPQVNPVELKIKNNNRTVLAHGSVFRDGGQLLFLIRLNDPQASDAKGEDRMNVTRPIRVLEALPDGFVILDADRRIVSGNNAFRELVQLATLEQLRGQSIDRWLGRTAVDLNVLFDNLDEHGTVSRYKMSLQTEYGRTIDVEVVGVAVKGDGIDYYGLVIRRDLTAANRLETDDLFPVGKSVEDLKHLVGRTPLRELVRQTTDIVERMCIQAALELTSDNRASAAEILGLSRQSLYLKLRRHNMAGFGDDTLP